MRRSSSPRFDDFRAMEARKDSAGCVNGADHPIKVGEEIGWSRRHKLACCAPCWASWVQENANAAEMERGGAW